MKEIYKAIGIGIATIPLFLGGCQKDERVKEYIKIQGTVFDEKYFSGLSRAGIHHQYNISIKNNGDRKNFRVLPVPGVSLESIDLLVKQGTEIEFLIEKDSYQDIVYANKIKIVQSSNQLD